MLTVRASERNCKAVQAYGDHKRSAKRKGNPFHLTFAEWQWLWLSSGHWNERGRKRGQYVMSRVGDKGPYAVGNVFIQTTEKNAAEGNLGKTRVTRWKMCKLTRRRVYLTDWRHRRSCPMCSAPE